MFKLLLVAAVTSFLISVVGFFLIFTQSGTGAPQTLSTDTIGTLRANVNALASETSSSSRVSNIPAVLANYFPIWTTNASSTLSPTSTLSQSGLNLLAGGAFNASGTITQNGAGLSTVSTSSANSWAAQQTFNGGLNVTSTSVFGSTISGAAGIFTGLFSVQTLNVTGTATLANLNVTNGNEYRSHTASIVVMNPSTVNHATGTVFFVFPVDATLLALRCHSTPSGTSTIAIDRRSSSTPTTAGSEVVASQACGSSAGTLTFTTSTIPAGQGLNFTFNPIAGTPSSTVIYVDYRNND